MLTVTDFLTVAGATAITTALVTFLKKFWPAAPEPWITWRVAEATVFVGGLLQGSLTWQSGLLLAISGMVVAAAALGSQVGIQKVLTHSKGGSA